MMFTTSSLLGSESARQDQANTCSYQRSWPEIRPCCAPHSTYIHFTLKSLSHTLNVISFNFMFCKLLHLKTVHQLGKYLTSQLECLMASLFLDIH